MKKIIASTIVMLMCATAMFAQHHGRPSMKITTPEAAAEKRVEMLKEKLTLTDDQATKLKTFYTESLKKEMELQKQEESLHKEREAGIKSILTPEQYEKLLADRQQMKDKMRHKGKPGQPAK